MWRFALGSILAFFTIAAGIGLMALAAFLISMCALSPPFGQLRLAIVGVRFFGTIRAVFRYFERLVTHDITFKLLRRYRVWFYERFEPLAPAASIKFDSGDLLRRIVADVESLEHFYARLIQPSVTLCLIIILDRRALIISESGRGPDNRRRPFHVRLSLIIYKLVNDKTAG